MTLEEIARTCHEVNKCYCDSIGDKSQVHWENAPEWQRQSAVDGVVFVHDNPSAPLSALHDNWVRDKVADGWVHGDIKDAVAKTHPCIVPFEELPQEQQAKDALFRTVVSMCQRLPI